jgi:hypothetical protein
MAQLHTSSSSVPEVRHKPVPYGCNRDIQLTTYLAVNTILGSIWTGVRVVEGTGLENRHTGNGIVGSNPTLSVESTEG